jgi:hypothetical protein
MDYYRWLVCTCHANSGLEGFPPLPLVIQCQLENNLLLQQIGKRIQIDERN